RHSSSRRHSQTVVASTRRYRREPSPWARYSLMPPASTFASWSVFSKPEDSSSSSTSKRCRNEQLRNESKGRGEYRLSFFYVCREAISDDVFGRRAFENRFAVGFQPRVSRDFAAGFVAHTENNLCTNAVTQQKPVQDGGAFPADWLEHEEVGREQ